MYAAYINKSSEKFHRRNDMNRPQTAESSQNSSPLGTFCRPTITDGVAERSFREGMWAGFWVAIGAVLLTLAVLWYGVRR